MPGPHTRPGQSPRFFSGYPTHQWLLRRACERCHGCSRDNNAYNCRSVLFGVENVFPIIYVSSNLRWIKAMHFLITSMNFFFEVLEYPRRIPHRTLPGSLSLDTAFYIFHHLSHAHFNTDNRFAAFFGGCIKNGFFREREQGFRP